MNTPYYYMFVYRFRDGTRYLYVKFGRCPSYDMIQLVLDSLRATYRMCDPATVYLLSSGSLRYITWKELRPLLLRKYKDITYYPELPFVEADNYVVPY